MKEEHQLSKCQRFKKGIYDSEKKAFLGRTFKSWALIFVFYVVAYSLLAGFFMGMISVFMYGFLDRQTPRLTGYQSILGLNPGVSFSPRLSPVHSFLHFTNYPSSVNEHYLVKAKELLDSYKRTEHNTACPNDVPPDSFPEVPCRFPTETLGDCNDPEGAIARGAPCVYIKLNTVYGWLPELENVTEFPTISIRCYGQNPVDTYLLGEPRYFPETTGNDGVKYGVLSTVYYPFINQQGFQEPLAAVQFPDISPSTVILVECRVYGLKNSHSSAHFEIAVDSQPEQVTSTTNSP